MWKAIYDSVQGTSHKSSGLPCQDACRVIEQKEQSGQVLIIVCADGAGSAARADLGAQTACDSFIQSFHDGGLQSDSGSAESAMRNLCEAVRNAICRVALEQQLDSRELACTFLAAVVFESHAAFAQIGDGAIVIRAGDGYEPVFWPQSGEYLNTTFFITDSDFAKHLLVSVTDAPVDELAMFTDGIERLALRMNDRAAHNPFFRSLFSSLREAADAGELDGALRTYLDSEPINERTDDDKTLVLATRNPFGQLPDAPVI